VMISLALAWYQENKQLDECTWPAAKMAKLFACMIKENTSAILNPSSAVRGINR